MISECKNKLCGITIAPRTLMIIGIEPNGKEGTKQFLRASYHWNFTIINSIMKESPISATKPIIHFSNFLYLLEISIQMTNIDVKNEPIIRGIPNSIFSPMAAPRISAKAVDIAANTALTKNTLLIHLPKNFVEASERQSPVTIPRCAALCCKI